MYTAVDDMMMEDMRERILELEEALMQITNKQYNDFSGDPSKWASTIAAKALGRRWEDGKLVTS